MKNKQPAVRPIALTCSVLIMSFVVMGGCEKQGNQTNAVQSALVNRTNDVGDVSLSASQIGLAGVEVGTEGAIAGNSNNMQTANGVNERNSISADERQTPVDISSLNVQLFRRTEQYEINQVARTSIRSEYEQMKRQLMGNEAMISNGDSAVMSGDTVCGEEKRIPGNMTIIAQADNRLYYLARNDSDNTISLLANNGAELWNKKIPFTLIYVSNSGNVVIANHRPYSAVMPIIEHVTFIDSSGTIKRVLTANNNYRFEGRSWMFCSTGNEFVFTAFPRLQIGSDGMPYAPEPTLIMAYDFNANSFSEFEAKAERIDDLYVNFNGYVCFYNYDENRNTIFNVLDIGNMEYCTTQIADSSVLCPYQVTTIGKYICIERSSYWENRELALFGIYSITSGGN